MRSGQRTITPSVETTHLNPEHRNEAVTIYYGWHPDTDEVMVVVRQGLPEMRGDLRPIPESEWRGLDFDDQSLVESLFTERDLQEIRKLIEAKNNPSANALLQYLHKLIGAALSE